MKRKPDLQIPGPLGRRQRPWRALWLRSLLPPLTVLGVVLSRALDLMLALLLMAMLAPLLLLRGVVARGREGRIFDREPLVGRFRAPFERLYFAGSTPGRGLAVLLNILRGDLAVAGPRPLTAREAAVVGVEAAVRFTVRPGVFSPYRLKSRTGVAYAPEAQIDSDYAYGQSARGDAGLVVRSLIGEVLGGGEAPTPPILEFFGVPIVNTTMPEAVDWIAARAVGGDPALLAFVNPDCLNIAYVDAEYRRILLDAARVLPDGIGIHIGCRMLGVALQANVNGTDLFPQLCERAAQTGLGLFLLGARPGIAEAVAANMQAQFPGLRIDGVQDGYFDPADEDAVIDRINASGAAILLVAFGVPRQEKWLARNHARLTLPVRMGVGGLFDFYSGRIPRAPVWMREIGLEWTWRLMQEPGRMWRRYVIGNPLFLYRVWRQARGGETS
ncbi:WecB/TagA/CpsF family glycosyltransferase [Thiocapsa rosea]|uniref:N-acetylglucosaminyldiphosphoundecaprenol N-acetyl-beta-D-mannosaminyltransferase n=1 Tax=Thiocapsa rosea TaxID=69360 RepID=A0A495V900_9GAMM|nr:WecB/TagA/CpsF family glycosyltransferase [Thiocapsa rosea]RKT44268.1 N-acetylglucosaminyldiphosphoundecaprenol N-acetyl-beta-D-mannosaminyltransferase [Thiocapsa rosea]